MNQHEANALIETIKGFVTGAPAHPTKTSADIPRLVKNANGHGKDPVAAGQPVDIAPALRDPDTLEWLYRQFKNRMIDDLKTDPIFLQLLENQNEIVIEIKPRIVTLEGDSLRGRVGRLIAKGFFDSGKRQGEARTELARTGSDPNSGQISTLFADFVKEGFLEKTGGDRYIKAASLKVSERRLEA